MLEHRSLFRFPVVFILALAVLLALSLELHSLMDGYGQPVSGATVFSRLQTGFVAAVYFLVLSGYLALFLLSYFLFTRKTNRRKRILVSTLGFVASYLFFSYSMADTFSTLEALLLVAGLISVVASDSFAELLERQRRSN